MPEQSAETGKVLRVSDDSPAPEPLSIPSDIFTPEQYAGLSEKGRKLGNCALLRGGSVDLIKIGESANETVLIIAVVRLVPITAKIVIEARPLIEAARAKVARVEMDALRAATNKFG